MTEPALPFGRTSVTSEELREFVDEEGAAEALQEVGIGSPDVKVDEFLSTLPALLSWLEARGREYPWRYTTDP